MSTCHDSRVSDVHFDGELLARDTFSDIMQNMMMLSNAVVATMVVTTLEVSRARSCGLRVGVFGSIPLVLQI